MVEFFTTDGIAVELLPDQDLAVTIDNAFLSSDRIPVAWTTDAEAAPSDTNCRLFGYPDAMLFPFRRKEINVEMRINSIPIMLGKLKLLGPSHDALKVSFVGVSIEDSLTGTLRDAPFNKWNFGKLGDNDNKTLFDDVMAGAAANTREDFATPLMMRDSEKDTPDDYSYKADDQPPYVFFATKYLNSPKADFTIPVVRLKYILQTVFADCNIDSVYNQYIEKIGIVAPYRKNGSFADYKPGCLDRDKDDNYILDLADSMPDVTVEDFVKGMLSTFCATIYITKDGKQMMSNNAIIHNQDFVDWCEKVADDMEQDFEEGQSYEYGFSGIPDSEVNEKITDVATLFDCFAAPDGTAVRCSATGDIYRKIKRSCILGSNNTKDIAGVEILRQEGMLSEETPNKALETFTATSDWIPVKSLPYTFIYSVGMTQWSDGIMTPIVEIPSVGGTRPSTIQFGILETGYEGEFANAVQLTSNGFIGLKQVGSFIPGTGTSINLRGSNGLYELFHRSFMEWLSKDKTVTKVSVSLSAADIANLQIWRKVMLYNQLFFIKTLSITLNTSTDKITSEADLISA